LREVYNSPRRTRLGASELSYEEDRYIVAEDAFLVVTRDAWFKRQSSFTDLSRIRVREGDEVAWVLRASTRSTVTFFGSQGGAWTLRLDDVPATAGHGEPLARHLALADGERVVGVVSHDPRHLPASPEGAEDAGPTLLVLTQGGRGLRFPLAPLAEPSTRAGRRVARLDEGDAVFGVWLCRGEAWLCLATTGGRAVAFAVNEVPEVKAAGKGVAAIKVEGDGDSLLAAELHHEPTAGPKVQTAQGREVVVSPNAYGGPRGGGKVVVKRGGLSGWTRGVALVGLDGGAGQPPAQGG
jgi:DNA gyrase subunit A